MCIAGTIIELNGGKIHLTMFDYPISQYLTSPANDRIVGRYYPLVN